MTAGSGLRLVRGAHLGHVKSALRRLPIKVAERVATEAAPALTSAAGASYDAGQTVYGTPRPLSVDGASLSLSRSGDTRATVRFVRVGTIVRCVLGTKYARYLIGKYAILPNGKAAIPEAWRQRLDAIARGAIEGAL